jgi:signal transduction histidine kinase
VISLLMTAAATIMLRRSLQRQEQLWMRALAHEVSDRAITRLDPYLGLLRGVRGLFLASVAVEPHEFAQFVDVVIPQLHALAAAIYAPERGGGATIAYVEPSAQRSQLLASHPLAETNVVRALQRAKESSSPIASTGPTFWIFLHVAKEPGFAGVQIRGDLLWRDLVPWPRSTSIGYQVFRIGESGIVIPYVTQGQLPRSRNTIEKTVRLDFAGTSVLLRLVADRHAADATWWLPLVSAAIGTLASAMVFALLYTQIAARRTAERLTELRDEFLSAAAHELKTPVTAIKGFSQLLREWRLDEVQRRGAKALASIERQADRINRLVQDMLEASRLQRRRLTLSPELIDLGALVRNAADDLRASSHIHQISCTCEGGAFVLADRERIEQVITNLLTNAVKYSPRGGEIRMSVREVGGRVVTSVRDFGIGIPADRQRHIFERYYQAHRGTAYEAIGGLGVGLHLSKAIVDAHGGRIWFESVEGNGSTFSFSLPTAKEQQANGTAHTDRR